MVSSTVYGIEELLDRVYSLLVTFGYEVWMSHRGTLPVRSDRTAFENCIDAVERCDLFLGLITPDYGSGRDGDQRSITHQEILRAIKLGKPRWLLTHSHVVYARRLLRELGYDTRESRAKLTLKKGAKSLSDMRVLDLYEEAILQGQPLLERHGNWVQEFESDADALIFVSAQFSRYQEVERFLEENLGNPDQVRQAIGRQREGES